MNKPYFIIIGAMRSGTTSLYNHICQHPMLKPSKVKEPGYFWNRHTQGLNWYQQQFPSDCITGEATVHYLSCAKAAQRIKNDVPNVKLIAILRNPVDRAYSHWQYVREREILAFENAIACELTRITGSSDEALKWQLQAYLTKGLYYKQLKPYFDLFDRSQLLILNSEQYYNNERHTLSRVFDFLNLPAAGIEFTAHNNKQYPPMIPAIREMLVEFYQPHNEKLWQLIGEQWQW